MISNVCGLLATVNVYKMSTSILKIKVRKLIFYMCKVSVKGKDFGIPAICLFPFFGFLSVEQIVMWLTHLSLLWLCWYIWKDFAGCCLKKSFQSTSSALNALQQACRYLKFCFCFILLATHECFYIDEILFMIGTQHSCCWQTFPIESKEYNVIRHPKVL